MPLIYVAAIAQKPQEMKREAGDGVTVWDGLNVIWGTGRNTEVLQPLRSNHGDIYKTATKRKEIERKNIAQNPCGSQ